MAYGKKDPFRIEDDLKDTVDISKMLSGVIAGEVGGAMETTIDKTKELKAHLKDVRTNSRIDVNFDESTFESLTGMIDVSVEAVKELATESTNVTQHIKNASTTAEMMTEIQKEQSALAMGRSVIENSLLPNMNDQLVKLESQVESEEQLLASLSPTSTAYDTQLAKVDAINSQLDAQFDKVNDIKKSIEQNIGLENYLNDLETAVSSAKDHAGAIKSITQAESDLMKQQAETITNLQAQRVFADELKASFDSIEGRPVYFNAEFDTKAIEKASAMIKQVEDNMASGNMTANIELTGDNEVLKLKTDLIASAEAAETLGLQADIFGAAIANATTEAEALDKIADVHLSTQTEISKLANKIPTRENEVKHAADLLAVENARLKALPEGTLAYEAQKTAMEAVEKTHLQAAAQLKSEQAQHAELVRFKDEFLVQQREELTNTTDIVKSLDVVKKSTQAVVSQTDEYQKTMAATSDQLDKFGDNFRKLAEEVGPGFDAAVAGIDSAKESILDLAGSIPIFGGIIKSSLQKPFDDAAKTISLGIGEGLKEMTTQLGNNASVQDAMSAGFGKMTGAIQTAGVALKAAFSGPFLIIGAILLLVGMAVKRFFDLQNAAGEFRENLGLAAKQAKLVEKNANAVHRELAGFGVELDDAYAASEALTRQMGSTMLVTKEQIALVAQLGATFGIAAETAAGVYEAFQLMGDGSDETAKNLTLATTALANAAGVPLDEVMGDIANASDTVYAFSKGTGKELAIAAVEARRLGTNIETVTGSMEKALDFETSIQGEMRMATMLGKHISMDAMRRASFEGDQVKFMEEQRKVLSQVGDLSAMNVVQRKAVAEAMGMEVGELMKMQQKEKGLQALASGTAEQRKLLAEYEQMQADIQGGRVKDVAKEAEEMIRQEKAQLVKERLMNQINKLMVELGSVLLPVIEAGMSVLSPILSALLWGVKMIIKAVEFVLQPLILIANVLKALTGDTSGLKEQFNGVGAALFAILGTITAILMLTESWTGIFEKGPKFLQPLGKGLDGIGKKIKDIGKGAGGMFKNIFKKGGATDKSSTGFFGRMKTAFSSLFSAGSDEGDGFFKKMADKAKTFLGGGEDEDGVIAEIAKERVVDKFGSSDGGGVPDDIDTDIVPDLTDDVPDGDGGSSGIQRMVEGFNQLDMKKVLQAAAALLVLSAALLVTAIALTQFNKVKWSSVLKGVVAIGMLVGGLYLMSQVLSSSQANLIKGAATILILGAALIPFAFALQMLSDVNWLAVALAGVTLVGLAIGAMILGGIASSPPFWIGIAGIIALGVALIPFAVAAIFAGIAMNLIAFAFSTMVGALTMLSVGDVLTLFLLGGALVFLGSIVPFAILATVALGYFALAMIPLAVGLLIAGTAITLFGAGLSLVIETIMQLPKAAIAIALFAFAMAMIAPLAPAMIITGIAIAFLGYALIPFGIAAIIAGAGMLLIATAFSIMVSALEKLSVGSIAMLYALGASMVFLAGMIPFALLAAVTIAIFTAAMIPFAVALMIAGAAITIFGAGLSLVIGTLLQLPEATAALVMFAFGVAMIAPLAGAIIVTAVALAIMGVALIPFGIGAIIAGAGMYLIATALSVMAAANPAKLLIEVANAFMYMGLMSAFILIGAIALVVMAAALWPFSLALIVAGAAIALFGMGLALAINSLLLLPAAAIGLLMFGAAVAMLGPMIPMIVLGAVAITIMAAALIPFGVALIVAGTGLTIVAIAFYIMSEAINNMNIANLFGLIGAFLLMGASLPIIFLGAIALTIMTAALIPFGVAALIAGLGLMVFATAFSIMTTAINSLDVGNLFAVIGAFLLMGASLPIIFLGAIALTIMTAALIPFGVAALIAGYGLGIFAAAFYLLATAMSMMPEGIVGTLFGIGLAMIFLGASVIAAVFAAIGLGIFASGLLTFAVAAMLTAVAVGALAAGMALLSVSLAYIATDGFPAIVALGALGIISPLLFVAAAGIIALAGALAFMAVVQAGSGLLSLFSSDDPFAMYIELGQHADSLMAAAGGLSLIADAMTKLADVDIGDMFEEIGEGFEEIFDVIDDVGDETIAKLGLIAESFATLFGSLGEVLSADIDIEPMLGFVNSLPAMAEAMSSMTGVGKKKEGGFFSSLFGGDEEEEPEASPLDAFIGSMQQMGDAMSDIGPGAESFSALIETLGGSADMMMNAVTGLDALTGAVYRFSDALDELGPFGMLMLGVMTAMGAGPSSDKGQAKASPSQATQPTPPDATTDATPVEGEQGAATQPTPPDATTDATPTEPEQPSTAMDEFKQKQKDNFMTDVGGQEKFDAYIGKRDEVNNLQAQKDEMEATNKSAPIMGGETDFSPAIVTGYEDEEENAKFQAADAQQDEAKKQQFNMRAEMQESYMSDAQGPADTMRAGGLFNMGMMKYENEPALAEAATTQSSIGQDGSVQESTKSTIQTSAIPGLPAAAGAPGAAALPQSTPQQMQSGGMGEGLAGSSTPGEASPVTQANATIQAQEVTVEGQSGGGGGGEAPSPEEMASGGADQGGSMFDMWGDVGSPPPAAPSGGDSGSSAGVEAKLDELIGLMKSGKIGVNMDGKKVERQLAKAAP